MTKKDELTTIVDELGTAYLTRKMIGFIDDKHRELVDNLSDIDPLYRDNLFKSLRDAIESNDEEKVESLIVSGFSELEEKMGNGLEIIRGVMAVVLAFPEVYHNAG